MLRGHGVARTLPAAAGLFTAALLGGCATGSSASFTMAPLFFTEEFAADGTLLSTTGAGVTGRAAVTGERVASTGFTGAAIARPAILPVLPAGGVLLASGNVALPIRSATSLQAIPFALLLGASGSIGGVATTALGPVRLDAALSMARAVVAAGGGAAQLAALVQAMQGPITNVVPALDTALPAIPATPAPATIPAIDVTIPNVPVAIDANMPTVAVPAITTPVVRVPAVTTPEVSLPQLMAPAVTVPAMTAPAITVPDGVTLIVATPVVTLPAMVVPPSTVAMDVLPAAVPGALNLLAPATPTVCGNGACP